MGGSCIVQATDTVAAGPCSSPCGKGSKDCSMQQVGLLQPWAMHAKVWLLGQVPS